MTTSVELTDLPIHTVLPDLLSALRTGTGAVLVAPPGAGKTTAVAPALLDEPWCTGTIVLTSPKRAASRDASSAEIPAKTLAPKKIAPSVPGFTPNRR